MQMKPLRIVFFGSPEISVTVLDAMEREGLKPSLIVTNPDRPQGRGLSLTPTPVKLWAEARSIDVLQPKSLQNNDEILLLTSQKWDLFVVVAYGLIMPKSLIDTPKHGTLNVHPSLLPKLRGASPIRTSILGNYVDTGVTIMLMDEKMDHGPILAQEKVSMTVPLRGSELDRALAEQGGTLLCKTIEKWIAGEIIPQEQNHNEATFCKKITKEEALLELNPHSLPVGKDAHDVLLKVNAYDKWPGAFFFHANKRIKIIEAEIVGDKLQINKVVPEGKKEIAFTDFLKHS